MLLTQYFPPERGAVLYGWNLAKGLVSNGHEVTVIAGLPHFPIGRPYPGFGRFKTCTTIEDGIRVVRIPLVMGSNTQSIRRVLGFITFSFSALVWMLIGPRPDIVISSVPPATSALSGWFAARLRRRPLVALLRDIEPLRALRQRGLADGSIGRMLIRSSMWIYRHSDRIVVMHEREVPILTSYGIDSRRIEVISHGASCAANSDHCENPTPILRRREGRALFLYAGTIGLVHGLPGFLESFADQRIRNLPVDLVIVGDGQERRQCVHIIERYQLENVTILPPVSPFRAKEMLAQADALICTFRNHDDVPLSSKFYDYCYAGKPILVYGRNLAGEIVTKVGNGVYCLAGDRDGLLRAVSELLAAPEEWRGRGEKGRAFALEHYSQASRDAQWESLITSVDPNTREKRSNEHLKY